MSKARDLADGGFVNLSGGSMTGDLDITGTLEADNVTDGTTSVPTGYVVNGSAKSWVNFNGTGTVAVRDSVNVSGLVDDGTGKYDVNLISSMGNTDYSVVTDGKFNNGDTSGVTAISQRRTVVTTSQFGIRATQYADPNSFSDVDTVSGLIHGDLA